MSELVYDLAMNDPPVELRDEQPEVRHEMRNEYGHELWLLRSEHYEHAVS